MADKILGDRRAALEEAFFVKQDALLLQKLKDSEHARQKKAALAAASGITDDAVLEKLAALDIDSATLAALCLVPLVEIAWADGGIDGKERAQALAKATEAGLKKDDVSYQLFERWLSRRPPPELLAAWKEYIRALSATLNHEAVRAIKHGLLQRARSVAEASGGFLGIRGKLSAAEGAVLAELENAFPRDAV